jgi:hypothetical protein
MPSCAVLSPGAGNHRSNQHEEIESRFPPVRATANSFPEREAADAYAHLVREALVAPLPVREALVTALLHGLTLADANAHHVREATSTSLSTGSCGLPSRCANGC